MPVIKANLDEVKPIDNGTYEGTILAATPGVNSKGGAQLEVQAELQVNGGTKKRTARVQTEGKGAFMFDRLLRATGFAHIANAIINHQNPQFDSDDLHGQRLKFVVEQRPSMNDPETMQDEIKSFLPL